MTDVVAKLWGFCNTLRDDGINYGDYIEQLTYLLFLKMSDERGVAIPEGYDWKSLTSKSGKELLDHYQEVLRRLSREDGLLGDIFAKGLSQFREPVNLKKLITMIDEEDWSSLDVDIKAEAYEGLLQKYAAEQKGAGQYFTPREAIRAVVRVMKPDFRENPEFTIHDPACGTGGFLIGAYEWIMSQTKEGGLLTDEEKKRLQEHTFSGSEIVLETKRLALMNLYLHEIVTDIYYGDSLAEGPQASKRYDCVLTNPPFGTKGAGEVPNREDFTVATSNKQLNFVQHVMHILKPGGRAAMVLPDNVLFEGGAGKKIRRILMEDCDLHTILRLPIGTFSPYSPGVKANIIFFRKGLKTEDVWIYDLRTNIEKVTKGHPLTADYFTEFEKSYGTEYNGHPRDGRQETERFKRFSRQDVVDRDENLDIFWLRDESLESGENLPDPETIVSEIRTHLQTAQDALDELALLLENDKRNADESEYVELPKGWEWSTLGDLSDKIGSGITPKGGKKNYSNNGIAFIRSQNVKMLELDLSDVQFISEQLDSEMSRTRLQFGDVLLNITGASIGRVAWFNLTNLRANVNQHVCIIRPIYPIQEWISLFLASTYGQDQIMEKQTGVTRQGLNYQQVASIQIPIPPLAEQHRIIARINELFNEIDECVKAVEKAIVSLEYSPYEKLRGAKIRNVFLKKAFEGKLVPQDPNDEPASVLLEHIRAEGTKGKSKQTRIA